MNFTFWDAPEKKNSDCSTGDGPYRRVGVKKYEVKCLCVHELNDNRLN
jgi:hypothetical protein